MRQQQRIILSVIMSNLQSFQSYFTLFYVFGLNPYVSFKTVNKTDSKLAAFLPRVVNITVHACIIYIFCVQLNFTTFLNVYARSVLICVIFANSVAVFENVYNSRIAYQLLQTISFTIYNLEISLHVKYPYKSFKKSVDRKFLLQIAVILVASIVKYFVESINGNDWKKSALWAVSNMIQCVNLFHFAFYLDFIKFVLVSLNRKVMIPTIGKHIHCSSNDRNELLYLMRQIKLIHFQLGHVSRCVNCLFGWFLVMYVIETMLSVIYNIFWSFSLGHQLDGQIISILRKYSLTFFYSSL